jgi:hypothetical protein
MIFFDSLHQPDFLIIGAQKCGTTSLFYYLSQHPDLNMPKEKEIHFFDLQYDKGVDWYYSLFAKKPFMKTWLSGEASPYYLFHPLVPERVFKHLPKIKIIVLLRNPVDRAYSHFMHQKKLNTEYLDSFEEAIESEKIRTDEEERKLINGEIEISLPLRRYSYLKRGLYFKQISNWLQYFSLDQFYFIKSEEFFQNTENELIQLYSFLGINYKSPNDLLPQNTNFYPQLSQSLRSQLNLHFAEDSKKLKCLIGDKFCWE